MRPKSAIASRPEALDLLPGKTNYLNREPSITGVRQYARIRYRSIYPGIDLVYHGRRSELEYDFDMAPGARPERIRLSLQGAGELRIDTEGNLIVRLRNVTLIERKPQAWQSGRSVRRRVDVRYVLTGKQEVAFAIGSYDRSRPLIIDPLIDYVTDLGSTATDPFHLGTVPYAIAADSAGNAYITGDATSGSFPVTTGGAPPASGNTGFVAKLSPDGMQLVYSTYLNLPAGMAIAVDAQGSAYVAGSNYIVKLTPDGSALAYDYSFPTPLGGTSVSHLVLDSANSVYISGSTFDYEFPTTAGVYQATFLGQHGILGATTAYGFLIKLNASGNVAYSTYLRDPFNGTTVLQLLAVDRTPNAIVVTDLSSPGSGLTYASSILELDASGRELSTTTLQNSNVATPFFINSIATDSAGDLYLAGSGPGFGTQLTPSSAWFLAELSPSGSLVSSVHIPFAGDVHVDASGNAYVVSTQRAVQETPLVARVASSFSSVTTFQLTSAPITDQIQSDTADSAGNVYVVLVPGGLIGLPPQIPTTPGAYQTNGGGFAVLKANGAALAGSMATPMISAIENNSSLVPPGFPNYGISPSTLFVIQGTNLANAGAPVLQNTANGLPTTLNGASISVTVGGKTVQPAIYYTCSGALNSGNGCGSPLSPALIAAVLPAATPVGTGTLTVTYNGTPSAPATIQVVPSALGFNNYNGGTAVAQDVSTFALLTPTHSGSPGELITFWATGLGADPADSDTTYTGTPHSVNVPLMVYIGGVQAKIVGQGASVYPGTNQINVVIPQSVPTGCYVPVNGIVNNIVSNTVTIPIAAGGGVCSDPEYGISGTQISSSSGQSTVTNGTLTVLQATPPGLPTFATAEANFLQVTGVSNPGGGTVSLGGCLLNQILAPPSNLPTVTGLDAGTLSVTLPFGSPVTLSSLAIGQYLAQLPSGAIPTSGGAFTFTGSGGTQVGSFTTIVNFPNPALTWTNQSAAATIVRSSGLQVTWTGGASGAYIVISGSSAPLTPGVSGSYTCTAPGAAGQFTVPPYILLGLPAGVGTTSVENATNSTSFSASGLDSGVASGAVTVLANSSYQ
jgi:uncharacterized protein (TIGR03437 family)